MKKITSIIEEVARWKKEVTAGRLSPDNIEKLKTSGVAKTPEQYLAGLEKGTGNLVNRAGFNIDRTPLNTRKLSDVMTTLQTGGFYTNPLTKTVRIPDKITGPIKSPINIKDKFEKTLTGRHEANEAKYYNLNKKGFNDLPSALFNVGLRGGGRHNSMNVITNEARDVNFYNNLFGGAQNLRNLRNKVDGEALQRKFGFGYNDINYDNFHDVKRKINAFQNKVIEPIRDQRANEIMERLGREFPNGFKGNLERSKNKSNIFKLQNSPYKEWTNHKTADELIHPEKYPEKQQPTNMYKRFTNKLKDIF